LGNGALNSCLFEEYDLLVNKLGAFVVNSLLGLGSFDTEDERYLGYIGHTGHVAANTAVHECDLLIVLGSRLDLRQTGTLTEKFVPNGKILWVDQDTNELDNPRVKTEWKIHSDLDTFLNSFLKAIPEFVSSKDQVWKNKILHLKSRKLEDIPMDNNCIQPRNLLNKVMSYLPDDYIVTTGVGCHQQWAARHLHFKPQKKFLLTSGGHGTMGYDLPSAIGASIAFPTKTILCVVGDGSLLMNIQELGSVKDRNSNLKILVLNNNRLGIVSQFQLITWKDDPTTSNFSSPDFAIVAKGFGIRSETLDSPVDMDKKLKSLIEYNGPSLLEVKIDYSADVVPMLLAGQEMNNMWMGE